MIEYWQTVSPGVIELIDRVVVQDRPEGHEGIWDKPIIEEFRSRRTGELLHTYQHGYLMTERWFRADGLEVVEWEDIDFPNYTRNDIEQLLNERCLTLLVQ